ncbi:MAG: dephospho-CoA kinase, partial [Planctomycetia bacterium]|nr:dephospho-CoA kinase [Planctomycetia bacterium]
MTIVIGLIGGIGCGKSTVAKAFLPYGATLFDADQSGHTALYDPTIKGAIGARFGKTVFTPTGEVSRQALAKIVFSNEEELKSLNQLIHPFIIEQFLIKLQQAQASGIKFFILDAPLLLETGMDKYCDCIIFIDTDESVRA